MKPRYEDQITLNTLAHRLVQTSFDIEKFEISQFYANIPFSLRHDLTLSAWEVQNTCVIFNHLPDSVGYIWGLLSIHQQSLQDEDSYQDSHGGDHHDHHG